MEDELGGKIMKEFALLRAKHIAIYQTTTMNIKKQKAQKSKLQKLFRSNST